MVFKLRIKYGISKGDYRSSKTQKTSRRRTGSWKWRNKVDLRQSEEEAEAEENYTHTRYLRNLIAIDNQRLMHKIIKSYSKLNQKSSLNHIDVSIATPADWNKIVKNIPPEKLTRIYNLDEMTKSSSLETNSISNNFVVFHSPPNHSNLF